MTKETKTQKIMLNEKYDGALSKSDINKLTVKEKEILLWKKVKNCECDLEDVVDIEDYASVHKKYLNNIKQVFYIGQKFSGIDRALEMSKKRFIEVLQVHHNAVIGQEKSRQLSLRSVIKLSKEDKEEIAKIYKKAVKVIKNTDIKNFVLKLQERNFDMEYNEKEDRFFAVLKRIYKEQERTVEIKILYTIRIDMGIDGTCVECFINDSDAKYQNCSDWVNSILFLHPDEVKDAENTIKKKELEGATRGKMRFREYALQVYTKVFEEGKMLMYQKKSIYRDNRAFVFKYKNDIFTIVVCGNEIRGYQSSNYEAKEFIDDPSFNVRLYSDEEILNEFKSSNDCEFVDSSLNLVLMSHHILTMLKKWE